MTGVFEYQSLSTVYQPMNVTDKPENHLPFGDVNVIFVT